MSNHKVVIATMTWARNQQEEKTLMQSLEKLASLNLPVFVTDGGSSQQFLSFLKKFPQFTLLEPAPGLWSQTYASLHAAYQSNSEFICYTEPDKFNFFAGNLINFISQTEKKITQNLGILLASRSKKGFETFPVFQQMTETTINNCCAEIIGYKTDYVYGPFLLHRSVVPCLQELPSNIGWGWRPYAFNITKRSGLKVESIEGEFACPADQREENAAERIYRIKQMNQNLEGLLHSTRIDLPLASSYSNKDL